LDTNRLLLAVILSLGVIFIYQTLVLKRVAPSPNQQQAQNLAQTNAMPSASASPAEIAQPNTAQRVVTNALPASSLKPSAPPSTERLLTIETDQYIAQVTTRGGRIKSFRLKRYRETAAPDSESYEMVPQSGDFVLPLGAIIARGDQVVNDVSKHRRAPARRALCAEPNNQLPSGCSRIGTASSNPSCSTSQA
jgi:YidC/Oxa1 family membrane protein insertase